MTVITQTANPAGANTTANVATYSAVSIGAAASDRIVVVCVGSELASASPNTVTIDYGSGATTMNAGALGNFGACYARIFYLPVPTGTTANIAVTFGAAANNTTNHIAVYKVTGASPSVFCGYTSATDMSPAITIGAVTIPTNGGMIAMAAGASDTVAKTWGAALTEDIDADVGTFRFTTATTNTASSSAITLLGGNNEDVGVSYIVLYPTAVNFGDVIGGGQNQTGTGVGTISPLNSIDVSIGDLIFIVLRPSMETSISCSDNLDNSYTPLNYGSNGNAIVYAFYAIVTVAGLCIPELSVPPIGANWLACVAYKGSFAATPLDINTTSASDSAEPYLSNSTGTLTQADELIIGYFSSDAETWFEVPTPVAAKLDIQDQAAKVCLTSLVVATTDSVQMGISGGDGGQDTVCITATFKKWQLTRKRLITCS